MNREGRRYRCGCAEGNRVRAEESWAVLLKVPRHDVASQFLKHATGVNVQLYVGWVK